MPPVDGCLAAGSQISFQLVERAFPGTVKLRVAPTSACLGVYENATSRMITFSSTVFDAGVYSFDFGSMSNLALQGIIDSVVPAVDLVDGTLYSYILEYRDAANNPAATRSSTDVAFSGTTTKTPMLTLPADGSAIGQAFTINFTLPERALRGSVKMRFNRVSGFEDPVGERAVTFSSEVEECGSHVVVIGGEGLATATQISAVESVTPSVGLGTTDLVDGATYEITLEYQDCGGHNVSVAAPHTVTYAGITTLPPVLVRPGTRSSIPREFYFEFVLPEVPCPTDKVVVTFLRSGGLIQDPFQGTREVKLDITTGGEHIFKMTDLSTAGKFTSKLTSTNRNM